MNYVDLINTVITLSMLLITGFIAGKLNIVDEPTAKKLSELILKIGMPFLLISSIINSPYSQELFTLSLECMGVSFVFHILIAAVAFLLCLRFKDPDEKTLAQFSVIFGNIGFLGLPVIGSVLGERGKFMCTFFIATFNILIWSLGIFVFSIGRKHVKFTLKKALLNFGSIPTVIAMIIFVSNVRLPDFVYTTSSYLASLCTPVSVIITGALISRKKLSELFLSPKLYYISGIRLLIVPVIICLVSKLLGFSYEWIILMTILAALPTAATISMLSTLYNIKPSFAAQNVAISTILSMGTIPLIAIGADFVARL